ncbi:3-polyprenyl-4-hydroxybenzoate decarboxylase [Bradyrhizobium sp. LB14.3]|uniref:hypothetical protein n=1 Tax=Bradyrhizobium sp. LB14.3 TaxID=3156328 RepID=UPI003391E70E
MPREFIYRSAELELDRLGIQHGWVPPAKKEAVEHFAKSFKLVDNDLIHMETGETIEEWAAKQKIHRPHWFLPDEVIDKVDASFAGGSKSRVNIDARSKLFREVGEVQFNQLMLQWGATPIKNGTRPEPQTGATVEQAKVLKNASNNPWSPTGWNLTKQGEVVKSLGMDKATAIAKAAGSYIGATRPTT